MIRFVGDINYSDGFFDLGFGIGSRLKKGESPFQNIKFNEEDIYVGNFECVCSDKSIKDGIESKYFRISKKALTCAEKFDIYGIANNHIMQHGSNAYNDTLSIIEKNNSVYIGDNKKKTATFYHNNYSVGIVNFSFRHENFSKSPLYWYLPEISKIEEEYASIKDKDLRIAYIHWGYEYMNYPSFDQQIFGRYLIDMGFNLIVGMHSHVLQGYEKYNDGYIFYSLGNFLFNMPFDDCKWSCMLKVDLKDKKEIIIDYDYIYLNENGFPEVSDVDNVPKKYRFKYLNERLSSVCNEHYFSEVSRTIKKYRKSNYRFILGSIFKYNLSDIIQILIGFIKRKLGND